jgi:predicted HTH domain antitoxin
LLYPDYFAEDLKNRVDLMRVKLKRRGRTGWTDAQKPEAISSSGNVLTKLLDRTHNFNMTATVEFKLPENVELSDFDIKMIVAAKLYENGTLSGGQAAELAGVSKRTFLELLGKYGVSIFGYGADELEEDLKRIRK